MKDSATQQIKLFAVVGNPIRHSLSPHMHNYAINTLGLKAFYSRFLLPETLSAKDLRDFLNSSDLSGINVTLPFKNHAFEAIDEAKGIAQQIGAINTIIKKHSKLIGYNTDCEGFYRCIEQEKPKNVLLLGAGGSAKSIATILAKNNITLSTINRTKEKLHFFKQFGETMDSDEFSKKTVFTYDIVINATSASIASELPLKENILRKVFAHCRLAFDLMYQENPTPFCALAKQCNIKTLDGKNMLIYQGALAFLYFHDLEITNQNFFSIAELMAKSLNVRL